MFRNIHILFPSLCRMYLDFIGLDEAEAGSKPAYILLQQVVIPVLAERPIDTITSKEIGEILASPALSSDYKRNQLAKILHKIFSFAREIALLDESPVLPSMLPARYAQKPLHIFNNKEMARLKEAFRHSHLQYLFFGMMTCGLTTWEVLHLKLSDFDPDGHTLRIHCADGRTRTIPLSRTQQTIFELEVVRQHYMEQLRGPDGRKAEYLFGDYQGAMLSVTKFNLSVKLIQRNANVPAFQARRLRQYFIIQSIRNGDNPGDVIRYVGMTRETGTDYLYTALGQDPAPLDPALPEPDQPNTTTVPVLADTNT